MFGSLKKKLNAIVKRFSKKAEEELEPVAEGDTEKMSYEKPAEEKAGKEIVKPKTEAQKPLVKKKIKLFGRITEKELKKSDIENVAKSLKLTLIESDVAYDVAENICDKLERDLVGKVVKRGSVEKIIKRSLKDSLLGILNQKPLEIEKIIESAKKEKRPATIVFVGFNGCGKTTSLAKMAYYLKRRGFKPLIAAADTFRAASIEQLETHGKNLGVDVIKQKYGSDSAAVIYDAREHAKANGFDVVLADTAGRSHSNINLMDELRKVCRVNKPDIKILVLDALTGNDVVEQAKRFCDAVGVDGIILTKADVYEKGGSALSACHAIKKPIMFLGVGQEYEDLEKFDAEKIVNSLMGENE